MADPKVVTNPAIKPNKTTGHKPAVHPKNSNGQSTSKANQSQGPATWIFGFILLVFFIVVIYFPPKIGQSFQYAALTLLAAVFAGLFGYFISGTMGITGKWQITPKFIIDARGAGGFALAILATAVFLFLNPYRSMYQAQQKFQNEEVTSKLVTVEAPGKKGVPVKEVAVTPEIQSQAAQLANADPKFSSLAALAKEKTVPLDTYAAAINTVRKANGLNEISSQDLESALNRGVGSFKPTNVSPAPK